jgi:hypothetical protein
MEVLFNYLPLLIFLICPISMIFMHKGHNHHGNECEHEVSNTDNELQRLRNENYELRNEVSKIKKMIREKV